MGTKLEHWKQEGLSLRFTFLLMRALSVSITVLLLYANYVAFHTFHELSVAADNYIELQADASSLLEASDYLTEQAQRYAVIGEREYLDNYINEIEGLKRREAAIDLMKERLPESDALRQLELAMQESDALAEREYYAMRLVLNAQTDPAIPDVMRNVKLEEADLERSAEEQMNRAAVITHDKTYYEKKNSIRINLQECIEELKQQTHAAQKQMEKNMLRDLIWMTVLIILQSLNLLFLLGVTTRLGINPVLQAVEHIRNDQKIPIIGASEFRYLAGTYNKMYTAYKQSIENLSFKASHDELTGIYNRAGYDLIEESVEKETSALLLFDLDFYKHVNDTYGHEIGDLVLKKAAKALLDNFRADDYVCRIGGDEFVVIMVHIQDKGVKEQIRRKVEKINRTMEDTSDGLPAVSFSVGVSLFRSPGESEDRFRQADSALYDVKKQGRRGVSFYEPGTSKEQQD